MSWSFEAIGTPAKVAEALEAKSENISRNPDDYCRVEFDAAKPHLLALVNQNFSAPDQAYKPVIRLRASGSACTSTRNNEKIRVQSNVSVTLESLGNWVG